MCTFSSRNPFLVKVPGWEVEAVGRDGKALAEGERARNVEMVRWVSDACAERGMQFQLGIWTHNYRWANSPKATYTISGLTPETLAPYSREALRAVLAACPAIGGVTLRTHGESGVPEGSYDLWKVIMSGVTGLKNADGTARVVELDLHAKTMTREMIETAQSTGMPVTLSAKFWAEHLGLPYVQASIRPQEMPKGRDGTGLMGLSSGTRSFLRYGLGDLARVDRTYKIIHRVWPGTQRLLLWGDPVFAKGYGECFQAAGVEGVEFMEPLSFKGRAGSGMPAAVKGAGRSGYAREEMVAGEDWEKYRVTYRLLGRLTYAPGSEPEVWRRVYAAEFGKAARAVEAGLGWASRILPLITTAHDPSAANYNYWPEVYVNQPLVEGGPVGPYGETPAPKVFGSVTSLDPMMFMGVREYVGKRMEERSAGAGSRERRDARMTPHEVADQLERWAKKALAAVDGAKAMEGRPAVRRAVVDVRIMAGIGQFFAEKLRAAVAWEVFERSGQFREEVLKHYAAAREAWARAAEAGSVYVRDLTFGPDRQLRGHWADRLAEIDKEIGEIRARPVRMWLNTGMGGEELLQTTVRPTVTVRHTAPRGFAKGKALALEFAGEAGMGAGLRYRHLNQGEVYEKRYAEAGADGMVRFTVPGEYLKTEYPLVYFLEVYPARGGAALWPGFGEEFVGQPYVLVMPE